MAHVILDRVLETTTTTGTGLITLSGNVAGFRPFSLIGNGNTTDYLIIDEERNQWEIGIGTYSSSANTLSRTSVIVSTNSNNAVNFQTGTKYVRITNAAGKTITTDNIGTIAQPLDADLTAIAALTGTSGLLKKTAANTWTLDTSSYLTGITSGMVTTALGFTPYNATNPSGYYSSGSNASFGTLSASSTVTLSGGTANGVAYLNASKQVTTGSALTFDGTYFLLGASGAFSRVSVKQQAANSAGGYGLEAFADNSRLLQYTDGSAWIVNPTVGATGSYLPLAWYQNGSEQMRLTSTGLGIGTSSPAEKLQVTATTTQAGIKINNNNAVTFIGAAYASGDYATGTAAGNLVLRSASGIAFSANAGTSVNALLNSSGNLGLGVTPSAWNSNVKGFDLSNAGAIYAGAVNIGLAANYYYNVSGGYTYKASTYACGYIPNYANNGSHVWLNAPSGTAGTVISFTQAMTLDASGNLLVGGTTATGTPTQGFQVLINSGQTNIEVGHITGTPSGTEYAGFSYNGSKIGSITQNGTTGVLYNITSDYRLKDVLGAVTGHGERIDALEPVEYNWKGDGSRARGFIAHKFQEVYPNSVTGEKDAVDKDGNPKYQTMQSSTSEVIADLVAEIQSLRKRITTLEAK